MDNQGMENGRMTKEKLVQLNDLRMEIRDLERKLSVLSDKKVPIVKDRVNASDLGFPYMENHTTITGYNVKYAKRKAKAIEKLGMLRNERRLMATELETEIEEYIGGIKNSRVRLMFEYRYVDGFKSEKVGELMNCDRTTVEKTIDRYLQEHP